MPTPVRIARCGGVLMMGLAAAAVCVTSPATISAGPEAPKTVRLYVFDCGRFNFGDNTPRTYHLAREQVADPRMSVPCFLIAHPKGTMMWDLGVVPDKEVGTSTGVTVATRTLKSQLAEAGYSPADITYVAMSHGHKDHSANANDFAASTWLTRLAERDFMFAPGNTRVDPSYYDKLKTSRTIIINNDEYDVFGDQQVVLKAAPGHSPGHQVAVIKLAKTGRIMLSGDLYHYPEERSLHTAPPDTEQGSVEQSVASRAAIEDYLKRTKTELWIEHDFIGNAKLKKAPDYYQ